MEENKFTFTEEEYLENRRKRRYSKEIFFFGPGASYSFKEIKDKLETIEKEVEGKEVIDIWVDASGYNEEGEAYLMVSWNDWETKEDYESRLQNNKWAKECAIESMKRLISRNKEEAVEILKELNLI